MYKERPFVQRFVMNLISKALRYGPIARGSHSFSLPATQTNHVCLYFVSIHQMAPPQPRQRTFYCSLLLIYRPRKDEGLSWPGWLTCSGWFTHIGGHPSAASRAQDRESSHAKDRRSTPVPRNELTGTDNFFNKLYKSIVADSTKARIYKISATIVFR